MSSEASPLFFGSIPQFYAQYLVPILFEPYAADLAARVAEFGVLLEELLPDSTVADLASEADDEAAGRAADYAAIKAFKKRDEKRLPKFEPDMLPAEEGTSLITDGVVDLTDFYR